ncbi:hypothetical protein DFR58_10199 [Anaerobacterium chartisolvens]|uniref:Uncharacterized protein n=1 Tax=Anaerobacterium chartisolvens TaxID=1297424 RepID=A0A369BK99_9FIRM|nr:hypothetical protein [Anaerobacterium chartisolvens]RCX20897.1 hypothetical protein DFR58_10199 [Anaerobacterium chartisolvens]
MKNKSSTKKPKEKEIDPSLLRPFTIDTDILILQLMVEDKATPKQTALFLGRDVEQVEEHINFLQSSGRANIIHKYLMGHKGVYARRYAKMKRVERAKATG